MLKASRFCWLVVALGCLGILEASEDWLEVSDPNGRTYLDEPVGVELGGEANVGFGGGAGGYVGGSGDGESGGTGGGGGEVEANGGTGGGGQTPIPGEGEDTGEDTGVMIGSGLDEPCPSPESVPEIDNAGDAVSEGSDNSSNSESDTSKGSIEGSISGSQPEGISGVMIGSGLDEPCPSPESVPEIDPSSNSESDFSKGSNDSSTDENSNRGNANYEMSNDTTDNYGATSPGTDEETGGNSTSNSVGFVHESGRFNSSDLETFGTSGGDNSYSDETEKGEEESTASATLNYDDVSPGLDEESGGNSTSNSVGSLDEAVRFNSLESKGSSASGWEDSNSGETDEGEEESTASATLNYDDASPGIEEESGGTSTSKSVGSVNEAGRFNSSEWKGSSASGGENSNSGESDRDEELIAGAIRAGGPFPSPDATANTDSEGSGDEARNPGSEVSHFGGIWEASTGSGLKDGPCPSPEPGIGKYSPIDAAFESSGGFNGSNGFNEGGSSDGTDNSPDKESSNGDNANSEGSFNTAGSNGSSGDSSHNSDGSSGSDSETSSNSGDNTSEEETFNGDVAISEIGGSADSKSGDSSNKQHEGESSDTTEGSNTGCPGNGEGISGDSIDNSGGSSAKSDGSSGLQIGDSYGDTTSSAVSSGTGVGDGSLGCDGDNERSLGGETRGDSGSDESQKDLKLKLSNFFHVLLKKKLPISLLWIIHYLRSYDITVDTASHNIFKVIRIPQETIYKIVQNIITKFYDLHTKGLTNIFGNAGVVGDLLKAGNKSITCVIDSSRDLPGKIEKKLIGCPAKTVKRVIDTLSKVVDDFRLFYLLLSKAYNRTFHCSGRSCRIKGLKNAGTDGVYLLRNIFITIFKAVLVGATPIQLPICFTTGVVKGVAGELYRFADDGLKCFKNNHII